MCFTTVIICTSVFSLYLIILHWFGHTIKTFIYKYIYSLHGTNVSRGNGNGSIATYVNELECNEKNKNGNAFLTNDNR